MVPEKVSTTKSRMDKSRKPLDSFMSMSMNPKWELNYAFINLSHSQMWGNKENLKMSLSPSMSVGKSEFSK